MHCPIRNLLRSQGSPPNLWSQPSPCKSDRLCPWGASLPCSLSITFLKSNQKSRRLLFSAVPPPRFQGESYGNCPIREAALLVSKLPQVLLLASCHSPPNPRVGLCFRSPPLLSRWRRANQRAEFSTTPSTPLGVETRSQSEGAGLALPLSSSVRGGCSSKDVNKASRCDRWRGASCS
ncbi:unnamed protein product [Caretta caretta]